MGFDWPALLRLGLGRLRLRPPEFWALTPGELMLMLGEPGRAQPLGRQGFDALMKSFPDKVKGAADE